MKTAAKKSRPAAKSGVNLFLELGVTPKEAKRLHGASVKPINDNHKLRKQLMVELVKWMKQNELKQAEAAVVLLVTRPRVSDLVNLKTASFTLDTLVRMMSRIGKPVGLKV